VGAAAPFSPEEEKQGRVDGLVGGGPN
jgi:hypothetical protein